MTQQTIRVGLLGFGTVGRAVWEIVGRNRERFRRERGVDLLIDRVLVRDEEKARRWCSDRSLPPPRLTTDPADVVENGIDVVVEVIGGLEPAGTWVGRALEHGKPVVTANKKLLASRHDSLSVIARKAGVRLGFEASVAGGVPIVRVLGDALCGDRVTEVCGIVNGTTNYILTSMAETGDSLDAALRGAQAAGFAEADPSDDINGIDAAEKIAILSGLAFGVTAPVERIPTTGIAQVTEGDIRAARDLGCVIRLIASARLTDDGRPDLRVGPALLPRAHPLARIRGERNAIIVRGESCGELTFEGRGAGGGPTASAVISDLLDLAKRPRGECAPAWRIEQPACESPLAAHYARFDAKPNGQLIERCYRALRNAGITTTRFAVARRPEQTDGVSVSLVTRPCRTRTLADVMEDIAEGASTLTAPILRSPDSIPVRRSS